jgi:preprotein translocase subunit SecD
MNRLTRMLASFAVGCCALGLRAQPDAKPSAFEVRRAESKAADGLTEVVVAGTKTKIYLHKEAALTGKDVAAAQVGKDNANKPAVEITLTLEGGKKLAQVTAAHQGKPLAILVGGKVIFAPVVREKIDGGKVMMSGEFTREDAARMVKSIQGK